MTIVNPAYDEHEMINVAYDVVTAVGNDMLIELNSMGLSTMQELPPEVLKVVTDMIAGGKPLGYVLREASKTLESATRYDELMELYEMIPDDIWVVANTHRLNIGMVEPLPAAEIVSAWQILSMEYWSDPDELMGTWLGIVLTPEGFRPDDPRANRLFNPAPEEPPGPNNPPPDFPDGSMNSQAVDDSVRPTNCGPEGTVATCDADADAISSNLNCGSNIAMCTGEQVVNGKRACSLLDVITACAWPDPPGNTCGPKDVIATCLPTEQKPPAVGGCIQFGEDVTAFSCDPFGTKKPDVFAHAGL